MSSPEENTYYEVAYNKCYGGFCWPHEFMKHVFVTYPPNSPIGAELWPKDPYCCMNLIDKSETPKPEWNYYHTIDKTEPYVHGYNWVYVRKHHKDYKTKKFDVEGRLHLEEDGKPGYISSDNKTFYFLSGHSFDHWRRSPEVLALAKEDGLFTQGKVGHTDMALAKIKVGYDYHINEYDGKESVGQVFPYNTVLLELVNALKTGDKSNLGPLSKQLLDGTLDPRFVRNNI